MEIPNEDIADNGGNIAGLELLRYSGDNNSRIQNITRYKYMKQLFCKYNIPIPSSVLVEGLFSFVGLTLCQRRSGLNDENFE
jgi:hypothetical protein